MNNEGENAGVMECTDFRFENVDLGFKGPEVAVKEWIQPQSAIQNHK